MTKEEMIKLCYVTDNFTHRRRIIPNLVEVRKLLENGSKLDENMLAWIEITILRESDCYAGQQSYL